MALPSCRHSKEHCTNFPVKTVIIEQWHRSKGDTSQGKRGQRILLKGDNITCGPNLEGWMRVRLTSWDEHSGNNNTWEDMLTKKTMTHCWSASSSVGLELWLCLGIKWGKQEAGLQSARSRGQRGHRRPCFSSCCCCLTNHPKLHALKAPPLIISQSSSVGQQSLGKVGLCSMWRRLAPLHWAQRIHNPHAHVWCFSCDGNGWLGLSFPFLTASQYSVV